MFDRYELVRLRMQERLETAARIREEQALRAAIREGRSEVSATAPPSLAVTSPVRAVKADVAVICSPDVARPEGPVTSGRSRIGAA